MPISARPQPIFWPYVSFERNASPTQKLLRASVANQRILINAFVMALALMWRGVVLLAMA
ncbi:MAG TPA: hypothetical protein DEG78_00880 [Rhodobacteraceae bacterium]|nr:hypothetical protein [Paracoccaceae bacterium]HCC95799.1 hypothetical protein [Paracoccaceae bacterium]